MLTFPCRARFWFERVEIVPEAMEIIAERVEIVP